MMDLTTIKAMNKEAEGKAKTELKQPYVAKTNGDAGVRSAPAIGDYVPAGWRPTKKYFVDSSGFGASGELALTFNQFLAEVKKGYGYAICEAGQFQVYIQEFEVD